MRNILIFILLIALSTPVAAQQNQAQQQLSKSQLASKYYRDKEFDKARDLYLELYESTKVISYFNYYITCLVNLKEFEQAEKQLTKVLRKTNDVNLEITLGYVYSEMGDFQKSEKTYQKVIDNMKPNRATIISIGNSFYNRREFEFAEKTYIRGQELMPDENFHSNLASVYAYQRNYDKMMAEYLTLLRRDETQTSRIQSQLRSLLRYDFDNSLSETLKREIIKSIQAAPDVTAFNRMLIWFFTIEENYEQALLNAIALDRRTNQEENNILNFSRSAARNGLYEIALNGLEYLENRTPQPKIINDVKLEIVNTAYLQYINTPPDERTNGEELLSQFDGILAMLGYSQQTVGFIRTYAHFLAFHMNKPQKAQDVLEKGLSSAGMNNTSRSVLQTEMADIYVYVNKLWEATLLYARIIEANKGNTLADEVMLKRARLSFYIGDIEWAKAQLDVLKASTSKFIANDAMDLSLLITSNYEMDTITEPVQMFARAELAEYRNNDEAALRTLDSLTKQYPNHSLNDRILMKKAEISCKKFDFEQCANYYQQVFDKHAYSTLADDAMYKMARLYEEKMMKKEQATELYRRIMIEYPGSIYVADSRTRYREHTGKAQEQEMTPYEMHDFIVE
ncbi:MAG: tetratricopeptide repeat protein [Prolixibacteraceae bacterium]|nr:tetratricopeptide repeat protein [Prolixibacteraceae bacterium]MBN2649738.1 tetratricopeptide repeat protein [Prolixibacteraceae bacterium]